MQEIKALIVSMRGEQYKYKSQLLADATIGQHIRHILEFYLCLLNGASRGVVNYDKRDRDLELENNLAFAIGSIDRICMAFDYIKAFGEFGLEGNFSSADGETKTIKTSLSRELAYCLEHSIHHQALIKIALMEQNIEHFVSPDFGVATATTRHKKICAQ